MSYYSTTLLTVPGEIAMIAFRRRIYCFGALTLVASLAILPACSPPTPPDTRAADEAAIRATTTEWAKVASAKDLEKTLSYHAEDASLFPPNAPVITGAEGRRKAWTAMLSHTDLVLSFATTKVEVARSGDLGYETGTVEESFKDDAGKPVQLTGKYAVVWKKQADGQWKAVVDFVNTDK
jgi:ketosteroid isomerase-like protein